jgi:RNA polymerase subunit RPABC4/transcription elongation factor Spt4
MTVKNEKTTICPDCGTPYSIGDYPFCRGTGDHSPSVVSHEWEGYLEIHAHPEPFWADSFSTLKQKMKENGSEFAGRPPGMKGQEI